MSIPTVRYDVFPAKVTSASGAVLYSGVRVVVSLDSVYIYDESQKIVYEAGLDDGWEDGVSLLLDPDDGTGQFYVTRTGGCGCGSRLKSFRPWNGNYITTNARLPQLVH